MSKIKYVLASLIGATIWCLYNIIFILRSPKSVAIMPNIAEYSKIIGFDFVFAFLLILVSNLASIVITNLFSKEEE